MLPALESLRDVVLFQGLSDAYRRAVAAVATERRAAAGEAIFRVGEHAEALLVILRGRVELTVPMEVMGETRDVRFQSLAAGRTLGWSALVPPTLLTMSARAATEVELVVLPGDRLLAVLEAQPAIGHVVMSNLVGEVAADFRGVQALWLRELQREVDQAA